MTTINNITVMSLGALQNTCWQNSEDKGFHDNEPTDTAELAIYNGNRLMLIVSEAAEALEEIRNGRPAGETYYPHHKPGCSVSDWKLFGRDVGERQPPCTCIPKPEGVPSEIADIVIRCFDFAGSNGFNLGRIIQEKLTYNSTREPMHGKKF
jgi:hypothetical protein